MYTNSPNYSEGSRTFFIGGSDFYCNLRYLDYEKRKYAACRIYNNIRHELEHLFATVCVTPFVGDLCVKGSKMTPNGFRELNDVSKKSRHVSGAM